MSKILLLISLLFIWERSSAQTFNGPGGVIPDGGPQTCYPVTVTGVGAINGTYGFASVCLNITHAYVSDLDIYLTSPDGTQIPLSIGNGGAGSNYTNTCFTATAATPITTASAPFTGNYLPEGNIGTFNNGQNANGVWNLCIIDFTAPDQGTLLNWAINFNNAPAPPPVIPSNDNPCNSVPLTVGSGCNYSFYTNENATASSGVPAPNCSSYLGGDVWFSVTVPAGGTLIFDTQTGTVTDAGMALYTGNCNALTLIACDDDGSSNGLMPLITQSGLAPGSTVWVRVWDYGNFSPGTFGICVSLPPPPPTNDNPCSAINLTVTPTCTFSGFTNVGSTATAGVPAPTCGNYIGNDVWFTATVPASGTLFINTAPGTMIDGDIAAYTGTCTALTQIGCDAASSPTSSPMASLTLTNQTPGATIWIRVWNALFWTPGTFQICVSPPPPPTVQDCPAAIPICQNIYSTSVSYSGTGTILNEINQSTSCLASGEKNDVWYTFTVQASGNLNFTITPNNFLEDYDWEVFNLSNAACSDIANNPALSVSCNYSATGGNTGPTGGTGLTSQTATGTPFNAQIPVIAGQTYVVNVSNFSSSANGYTINFGASTAVIFDNVPPVLESVSAASTCGGNQLTVNFSENVLCSTIQNADFALNGPGGPYMITGWASASCTSGATYGNNITLNISPAIATNGAFQICLTSAAASVTDLCGNVAAPACLNFNIATTIPAFSIPPVICQGATPPVLPAVSNNGVTGVWSPATVNTSTSGSYTFTPNTGQCAVPVTVSITVSNGILPTFDPITAICSGSVAPVLPTTSNNGITGSWTPATVSTTTTGTYTFNPNNGQCAITTTLTVTVNNPTASTTSESICSNQLPFSWNGNTYPAAGTYSVTLVNSAGCDSVATLNLVVDATVTSTTTASVCTNQLPYSWNGNSYPAAGTYSVTLVTSAGCDSIASLNLTENAVVTSTTNISVCTNQLPYTWNGNNYPAAGIYSVTLLSSAGCDSIATLNLTENAVVTSTTNITVCTNQLPYTWNGNNYPAAGTYSVTLVSSAGCDSIASLNLTENAVVTSTTNISVCTNQLPYTWNGNNYPAAGTYSVTLLSSAGCDSIATLILTENAIVTSTTNISICTNQLPYSWNGNSYPAAGTYSVTLVSSAGCDSIASLNLTENAVVTSTTNISVCTNQLPYTWNGNNYPAAGIYSVTLVSSAGCDSIATLNLTENAVVTSTTNISVCTNQLPYTWNGNNYPAAGIYSVTLVSSAGCDSIATLNLTENAVVTSTTNISVCTNQLPYTWNGNNYPAAGTYSVTLVSSAGCDSIATLNLTENAVVTSTTNISVCTNQLPYTWNGNSYPAAGTYSVTLVSSAGCDSIATLNLTENAVVTSTTNISVCTNQLPYSWNGNNYPAAGTYSVTLVSSAGCDSIATLNLTENAVVTSTTNISICSNQLPYSWNGNNYPAAGTYSVTLVSSAGCDSIATLNLTENAVVTSTTNISICSNQLPYSWNGNNYPAAGSYSVTLISSAGCDSIATLNLTENAVVTSTTNISVCTNQLPYSWNGNNYPAAGTYSVTLVSSAGCDSVATLNLTENAVVTSTTNISVCSNQLPYSWNGNNYPAAGSYSVTLISSAGCDSIATLNLTENAVVTSTTNISVCSNQLPYSWNGNNYPAAGTYSVTLVSSAGCDSIATLNLTENAVVTSTTNISVCTNQLPYTWNGNNYPAAGTYSVTLVSSAGCDSIATLNLTENAIVTSTTNISVCTNQLPYSWNGNNYPAAGSYSVTLISSAGCDSVATLNLTENAVVTSTTNISVCTNQLPYTWNGNNYPAAGTYSVTLISSAGCDSIATLNLTENAVVTSTTNISVCSNQLPYSWNGNNYPAAGIYSVTLVSSAGCDSIATLNLTENAVVTSTTNISVCTNQLPYTWNGNNYPAAGTYSVTLVSSAGCDSIATLNLTENAIVTSTTNISVCTNQLPYSWNGNNYPAAGSYSVTLISSAGCDSVATLNLTENAVVTSTTNISVCTNQLPYTWNGNNYPAAGTYSVTLISSAGCDSIATLNLTENAVVTSTTNISVCSNQLPYSWNGNNYPAAGIYSVTLVSSAGCDSIATLNLTENAVVTSTTNISVCTNQLPYTWNGNNYPAAGTYSVTLVSSAGCDSIATLNLTENAIVTSTTNISVCTNQLPYSWNGNNYPAAGSYSVTLISSAGCDSVATLNLTENAVVTSTTNISVCTNQLPYTWNGNNYPAAGTYSVTLISSAGCDSIATLNLTANNEVTSITDVTICTNQLPYSWNGNTYPAAGTYSVTLISSAGCDSIATLNLTANNEVTSTTDITICTNQLPYSWNGNTYPAAGSYSVTLVSNSGCDSIATLNLTANNEVTSSTDVAICTNQLPYSWNGNTYPAAGTYSVTLVSNSGCDSIATLNLTANNEVTSSTDVAICTNQLPYSWNGNTYPAAGTYSVTLVSNSGCDSIATLNLTANNEVTSTTDVTICTNQLPYSWNGNTYPAAGSYSVTLVSNSGCDSMATLNLTANNEVTSTTDVTICTNQLPYSWNGNTYPAAGSYSVTLVSNSGCDSIATLNLTANNEVTSTTDITICTNQLPYSWNGNTYPAAGSYSVTLVSNSGCDSIATLNLTANNEVISTTDITICTNQLPYSWNGNTYPAAGSYSVTLVSNSGCDSIATLNLTTNNEVTSTTDITICTNQLPYSWNGNTYPAAGTYSVTLVSNSGCDSIATLNLTANNEVTSTTDITICTNQLPYSWNGNTYPAAGTYSVTLVSNSGCDSIATLNLTANNEVTSTTDITICTNQLPYSWNGNTYPAAGSYSVTLVSNSGCDSIATLNLTANNEVTSTTDITICTNQLPYSWNGNTYPAAGTYSVTLVSNSGCDSIATLNLTANNEVTSTTDIMICTNQLPYSWNGNTYPAAGSYSVTLVSNSGCDSIATLNLTANNEVTSTTDVTICTNQLPYSWNGNTYPAAGSYSVTLVSNSGCDSIATLTLTVNPIVTSTTAITICTNQLPYTWNGNTYPAAGSYSVTLVSNSGCDSIATLTLVVNIASLSTTPVSLCNTALPYIWNGQQYSATGLYTQTFINNAGCDSVATLQLTVLQTSSSFTTQFVCANSLPFSWNGNSYPAAGNFSVTLVNSNGCDSIANLSLIVNPVTSGSTTTTVCNNQLPFTWNGQQYSSAGIYIVTLTGSQGCDSIATLNLIINNVSSSITNVTVCSATLPYTWNGLALNSSGSYQVILVNNNGCDSLTNLNLTVNQTPGEPQVNPGSNYCQFEQTVTLSATTTFPGAQLIWYTTAVGSTGSPNAPTPPSNVPGTFTYYVSQTLNGCEGPRAAITIVVNPKPALGNDVDLKICYGQSANLNNTFSTAGLNTTWYFNGIALPDVSAINASGAYVVVVSNTFGCVDSAVVNLTINPLVVANAGPDIDAETNTPFQLSGTGGVQYQWTPATPLNNPFISNPSGVLQQEQTFILLVSDDIGCFDLDTMHVRVLDGPTFYIPTAFTPNADGLNDVFGPTAVGMRNLDYFRIYNRFGELLYETQDVSKGWDGTFKGKRQDIGGYVWTVKGTDRFGKLRTMKGHVTLIR